MLFVVFFSCYCFGIFWFEDEREMLFILLGGSNGLRVFLGLDRKRKLGRGDLERDFNFVKIMERGYFIWGYLFFSGEGGFVLSL